MSNSTLYVFLILFFAVTNVYSGKHKPKFSDEIKEIIQHIHNECVGKTGAAEEDIQNCENGIFKDDPKLKCYMFCLLEEASLVDDDGIVDYDMMISLIPEDYYDPVSKMIFTCKHLDTPDKDKCQRAFDVHKCSYEKNPDLYFLF
ncbi:general odorant-binding protein 83a-like isoform X2 [Hyposmocoma kahamanoa]|uniref:general odorant-binding protein 83a-like isoform X2 n=1 Tax=Hyposmocoma kahamanoa TaxID=1477025 RepID=UPI000E6D9062|nr:general odorant-binding protein 83a-like isoform X2 [Hyposmocoma kahamanoa]